VLALISPDTPDDRNDDAEHSCPEEQQHTQVKHVLPVDHGSSPFQRNLFFGSRAPLEEVPLLREARDNRHASLKTFT
jgi:hypothetical protein